MAEPENAWGRIVARCREDDAFKARLLAAPAATLVTEGVEIPEGVTVQVIEDTEDIWHVVLPWRATALSDDQVGLLSGGIAPWPFPPHSE